MISACLTILFAWQGLAAANASVCIAAPDRPCKHVRVTCVAQDPKPGARLPEMSDRQAKEAVRLFQKALKGKPSMANKKRALDQLVTGSNKAFVKPLCKLIEKDKMVLIRRQAAELLAQQPAKQARPAILKLLQNPRIEDTPVVAAAVVKALCKCGYEPSNWKTVEGMFERSYAPECVPLHEAILDLAATHKETQALKLLLRNLDEPIPADPDSPTNPPAEYWEARWKAWKAWRSRAQEALFQITGQRFSTAEEAQNWLKKNPLE